MIVLSATVVDVDESSQGDGERKSLREGERKREGEREERVRGESIDLGKLQIEFQDSDPEHARGQSIVVIWGVSNGTDRASERAKLGPVDAAWTFSTNSAVPNISSHHHHHHHHHDHPREPNQPVNFNFQLYIQ